MGSVDLTENGYKPHSPPELGGDVCAEGADWDGSKTVRSTLLIDACAIARSSFLQKFELVQPDLSLQHVVELPGGDTAEPERREVCACGKRNRELLPVGGTDLFFR